MLVLLIVFMVTAPLLTTGVAVSLPKSEARKIEGESEPLTISVTESGKIFMQESEIADDELLKRLQALAENDSEQRIYVRGDKAIDYGRVMTVMGAISAAGLTRVALVTLPLEAAASTPAPASAPEITPPSSAPPAAAPSAAPPAPPTP